MEGGIKFVSESKGGREQKREREQEKEKKENLKGRGIEGRNFEERFKNPSESKGKGGVFLRMGNNMLVYEWVFRYMYNRKPLLSEVEEWVSMFRTIVPLSSLENQIV